jgi:hypothetical protein
MREIKAELARASEVFSPDRRAVQIEPSRFLWDLVADGALITVAKASGSAASLATALIRLAHRLLSTLVPSSDYIFRRGAFDLARHVRSDLIRAAKGPDLLDRFLSDEERQSLSH